MILFLFFDFIGIFIYNFIYKELYWYIFEVILISEIDRECSNNCYLYYGFYLCEF